MSTSTRDLQSMQIKVEKLSKQNRRLSRAFVASSLLAVALLIRGQVNDRSLIWAQAAPAPKQGESGRGMWFDGQRIVMGMTRTEALDRLSKCCKTTGGQNAYFISKRGETAEIIGAIWFAGDSVTSLKRELEYYPSADAVRLARTVYHEILNIADQGEQVVTLSARTTELASGTSQVIELTFPGGRSLVIEVMSVDDPKLSTGVSVSEYQR